MGRARNRKPSHPGKVFKLDVLEPTGTSITKAAEMLDISRKHLSKFVNEGTPCSPDMAKRLAIVTGTSLASWLNMQTALDIWEAENDSGDQYDSLPRLAFG